MRIYKPTYTDKDKESHEVKKYWLELRDHKNHIRRFPDTQTKARPKNLASRFAAVECRGSNDPLPNELNRWLSRIPSKLRQRLVQSSY